MQIRSPSNQVKQLRFAATGAVTAKLPFIHNSKAFFALNDEDAATVGEHVTEAVMSDCPKATGEAWAVGDALYWNATNGNFTKTASGATACGYAASAQLSADTTGWVDFKTFV